MSIKPLAALASTVVLLAGCAGAGGDYTAPKSFTVSDATVTAVVKQTANNGQSPGLVGTPKVSCTGRTVCSIAYTIKQATGASADFELLDPMRQMWKALFTDPQFVSAVVTVSGPTTSAGGTSSTGGLFNMNCSRTQVAAAQIDWDSVDPKALRKLCTFAPLVTGL